VPSPDADRLTRQHRAAQAAIGRAVVRPIRQTAQTAPLADVDGWFERVLPRLLRIVAAGWAASRNQASRYLIRHAALEGVDVEPVRALWTPQRVIASARVTGPVAFKEHVESFHAPEGAKQAMVTRLTGAMQRQALAGGRDTLARTIEESDSIVGWRRVTDADPCAFCAMLASRGAVYNERTVRFEAHDGDECTFAPLYEHEDEPDEVQELYQQWLQATAGHSGKAAIRAWRRYWDKRRKDG
jgi:hypothetical protein